jgi:type VI secretion system Hcp family effector
MDNSSVKLQKACASGEKISKVEIHLCTVLSDKREPFLIYELEDAFITSYQFAAQITENSGVPTESVSFNFNKITWTYVSYGQDGKKRGKLKESYKIGENK